MRPRGRVRSVCSRRVVMPQRSVKDPLPFFGHFHTAIEQHQTSVKARAQRTFAMSENFSTKVTGASCSHAREQDAPATMSGLRDILARNAAVRPNTAFLQTLRSALPQFFDRDGIFLREKFDSELRASNVAEARDGYRLGFVGKDYARLQFGLASETLLVPDLAHNARPENAASGNIFITGDNLEALRHLVNAYENQVKFIYIDPPYNTGQEFTYSDKFEFSNEKLKNILGCTDEEITRLKSIQGKSSHSAWLTFMYPRLKLAQKLLRDDGVIFVSIDDNEQANLRLLMDDVFGEGNFVTNLIWKSKLGIVGTTQTIATTHEYIQSYANRMSALQFAMEEKNNDGRRENLRQWGQADRREDRPSMYYPITLDGIEVLPIKDDGTEGRWRVGKEMADMLIEKHSHPISTEEAVQVFD